MRSTPCSGGGLGLEIHSSFVTGIISAVRWRFPPSLVVLGLYIYQVMSEPAKEVVVIGAGNLGFNRSGLRIDIGERLDRAGVVGLSTAIKIQEHGGYHVTVIGETIPGDPKSIYYTSPWAVRFIL